MPSKYIVLILGIASLPGAVYMLLPRDVVKKEMTNSPEIQDTGMLSITPQKVADLVKVTSVDMPADGWVVARAVESGRLSQIIEISPFLTKGKHENIAIPLGDFYNNEELIVMVYSDNGDTVFNDLDLPTTDAGGQMIARLVTTGEPLPSSYTESDIGGMTHTMPGMAPMLRVRYTNNGFEPKTTGVSVGDMVEFVNESDSEMWVASNEHPEHGILPTFDQFKPFKKGAVYRYAFDKAGAWKYHDHLNPERSGIITVK